MNTVIEKSVLDATEARQIRAYVDDLLNAGITLARIAVESGVSSTKLKAWIAGGDGETVLPALMAWKAESDAAAALNSGFVMTPTARRIASAFDRARQAKGSPSRFYQDDAEKRGIALIYGASGAGKSETAEWYQAENNKGRELGSFPVVIARCTGAEKNNAGALSLIIEGLMRCGLYRQTHESRIETIRSHIPEGGLIIFDEAQLLSLRRMDEMRYFPDKCGIAIAFMGNMAGYTNLKNAQISQITSRVGGALVVIETPSEGDVDALLDAWGVSGRKVREIALMIGMQDGGLRLLSDTVTAARVFSQASGKRIDEALFKSAAVACGAWKGEA